MPDVIYGHTLVPAGWAAVQLGQETGTPVVVTIHSSFASQRVLTRSSSSYVRHTMSSAAGLVAVGPTIVDELRAIDPDCDPSLIPNLVDDDFFAPAVGVTPRSERLPMRIVGIGNLIASKRFDLLLRVMARLRDSGTDGRLAIVGDGPERKSLESDVSRLGLYDAVTFAGAQDRHGVRAALHEADVLVHPSRTETFGVVLIEAMACGVPVIATRSGGPDWIVRPGTGQLVDVDDENALAAEIRRHAQGRALYDRDFIRAYAVDRFGRRQVTDRLVDLFHDAISRVRARP